SRPFGFQAGPLPPSAEIAVAAPGPASGRTYTSDRPVPLDVYASHRPSGETIGWYSWPGVATICRAGAARFCRSYAHRSPKLMPNRRAFGIAEAGQKPVEFGTASTGDEASDRTKTELIWPRSTTASARRPGAIHGPITSSPVSDSATRDNVW